jgi:transposase
MKEIANNKKAYRSSVYCLVCTHTVEADVIPAGRKMLVRSGQKCPRCSNSLDAACVVFHSQAA